MVLPVALPALISSLGGALGKGGGRTKVNVSTPVSTGLALDTALSASVNPVFGISIGGGALSDLRSSGASPASAQGATARPSSISTPSINETPGYGFLPGTTGGLNALADIDESPFKTAGILGGDTGLLLIVAAAGAALFFLTKGKK